MTYRQRPPLRAIYMMMKQRCYNPNHDMFKHYWGRGIKVCDEWLVWYKSFEESIYNIIGTRPSPKHTLDRIDNNWNYTPDNIRRATWTEQFCNRSDNIVVNWKTLSQRARLYKVSGSSFGRMYHKKGFDKACDHYKNKEQIYTYNNLTCSDIAKKFDISTPAIYFHLKKWKSLEWVYNHFLSKVS